MRITREFPEESPGEYLRINRKKITRVSLWRLSLSLYSQWLEQSESVLSEPNIRQ